MRASLIGSFFLKFMIVFSVLSIPWQGITQSYARDTQEVVQMIFGADNSKETITVGGVTDDPLHPYRSRITIVNLALMNPDGSGPIRNVDFDTVGFSPFGCLVSLILASPVSWLRRLSAIALAFPISLVLSLLFLAFCLWDEASYIGLVSFSPAAKEFVDIVREIMTTQMELAIPILLWLTTTFRASDFIGRYSLQKRLVDRF